MKLKKGVELAGLDLRMRPVLIAAEEIWKGLGRKEGVTITCTRGDVHSAGSLHPYGLALDLRIRYFSKTKQTRAFELLKIALGNSFDVILHSTHIHVEYDI